MKRELSAITDDEFQTQFGLIASTLALHRALSRSRAISTVRQALIRGQLDDSDLRQCSQELMGSWLPGQLFIHDVGLAAIAVILEDRMTDFADEYLHDLARIDLAELPKATRVARHCLIRRSMLSHNISRQFLVSPARMPDSTWRLAPGDRESGVDELSREYSFPDTVCPS